jgi:Xaa-Pro aminopeptidase
MSFIPKIDYSLFKSRREQVLNFIRQDSPNLTKGFVMLFADFENVRSVFRQESSFYYLTGLADPGAVLVMYLDGTQILYLPNYGGIREKWTTQSLSLENKKNNNDLAKHFGVDEIRFLGQASSSYLFNPTFSQDKYENLLSDVSEFLNDAIAQRDKTELFVLLDGFSSRYVTQAQMYKNLLEFFPVLSSMTRDLAPLVHYMRRFKSEIEIDLIYKAVQVTVMAHQAAAKVIEPKRIEYEIQAIVESIYTQAGAMGPSFPSIIATGKNTTILHYTKRDQELNSEDLVVIDIGAEYGYYAADLTRTYPVNGKFTPRQLEIYNAVLDTLTYAESIIKEGMYLNNPEAPENSLNHLVTKFLEKKGLSKYIAHGIGHFVGLDVHDVTDNIYPLSSGDVFTIEPGLYIPEENIGIRIEDNYLMTDEGAICLSFQLPRKAEEIENLMKKDFIFE